MQLDAILHHPAQALEVVSVCVHPVVVGRQTLLVLVGQQVVIATLLVFQQGDVELHIVLHGEERQHTCAGKLGNVVPRDLPPSQSLRIHQGLGGASKRVALSAYDGLGRLFIFLSGLGHVLVRRELKSSTIEANRSLKLKEGD